MGGFILFIVFLFVLLIAVPIVTILRLVMGTGMRQQQSRRQSSSRQEEATSASSASVPRNKRFDKTKAEDVEFEEV